jgi:hypothetical protein
MINIEDYWTIDGNFKSSTAWKIALEYIFLKESRSAGRKR